MCNCSLFRLPTLTVPSVTIDVGSAEQAGTAAFTNQGFIFMYLPNTASTTSSTLQTALNYTGSGILQRLIAISQNAAETSTAAGVKITLTIDGAVVYTSNTAVTAVSRTRAIVGSLSRVHDGATTNYVMSADDPQGIPFRSSCKIEFASGTNGQGVQVGWRVLKKT